MVKKMKISSLFKNNNNREAVFSYSWACKYPKTQSFRAGHDDVYKTVNSVFFDDETTPAESWFTNSLPSESAASFSTESAEDESSLEIVLRGVKSSERLFFEPRGGTRSILQEEEAKTKAKEAGLSLFNESSVVMAMESENPYADFKKSMEEMVESHGLKDWDGLEELLGWYLKMNAENNHGFIVDAFVDLLVGLPATNNNNNNNNISSCNYYNNCDNSTLYSSAVSSLSSCSLSDRHSGEIVEEKTTSFYP